MSILKTPRIQSSLPPEIRAAPTTLVQESFFRGLVPENDVPHKRGGVGKFKHAE